MKPTIKYERVDGWTFCHQVSVTTRPGFLLRFIRVRALVRIFVNQRVQSGQETVGWYEIPEYKLLNPRSRLAKQIAEQVRKHAPESGR